MNIGDSVRVRVGSHEGAIARVVEVDADHKVVGLAVSLFGVVVVLGYHFSEVEPANDAVSMAIIGELLESERIDPDGHLRDIMLKEFDRQDAAALKP